MGFIEFFYFRLIYFDETYIKVWILSQSSILSYWMTHNCIHWLHPTKMATYIFFKFCGRKVISNHVIVLFNFRFSFMYRIQLLLIVHKHKYIGRCIGVFLVEVVFSYNYINHNLPLQLMSLS